MASTPLAIHLVLDSGGKFSQFTSDVFFKNDYLQCSEGQCEEGKKSLKICN